ncbi:MAG: hypothetical protein KBD37_01705 [Burkholderiales bacterium]|nr:hypothetical protein [Burkholderiales bacterium]
MSFLNNPDIIDDGNGSVLIEGHRSYNDVVQFGSKLENINLMMQLGSATTDHTMQFYTNGGGNDGTEGIIRCNNNPTGISFPTEKIDRPKLEVVSGDNRIAVIQDIPDVSEFLTDDDFPALLNNRGGWQKLPSGLIIQWGFVVIEGNMYNIIANFPIAFPKACFGVLATNNSPYNTTVAVGFAAPISTTQVNISFVRNDCDINMGVFYVAIGN